jgi:hypothetical protein
MTNIVQNTFFIVDKTVQEVLHDLYSQTSGVPLYKYISKEDAVLFCKDNLREDTKQDLYCLLYEILTHTDAANEKNLKFHCRFTFLQSVSTYVLKRIKRVSPDISSLSPQETKTPEEQARLNEVRALVIFSCNKQIPVIYRYVIYLYYWKELNLQQIAKLISKDVKTVRMYFMEAHTLYKKIL